VFTRALCTVVHPFLAATPLFIFGSHAFAQHSTVVCWAYSSIGVVCFTVAPLAFILYLYLSGRISDFDISERPERERVFAGFVVIYLIAAIALSLARAPVELQAITWGSWGTALETMVIPRWWKISTHALGITAPLVALTLLYRREPLPFLVLIPIVCWARVYLRAHTVLQVVAGSALATFSVVFFFWLFHVVTL